MKDDSPIIGDLKPPKRMPRLRKKPSERMKLTGTQRAVFVKMGKLGGAARAKALNSKELSDIGRKAARARWKMKKTKKNR